MLVSPHTSIMKSRHMSKKKRSPIPVIKSSHMIINLIPKTKSNHMSRKKRSLMKGSLMPKTERSPKSRS